MAEIIEFAANRVPILAPPGSIRALDIELKNTIRALEILKSLLQQMERTQDATREFEADLRKTALSEGRGQF